MPDAAAQFYQPILRSFYPQPPGPPADRTATITHHTRGAAAGSPKGYFDAFVTHSVVTDFE